MSKLIESDFYRLFKMKSFYVCLIVAAGLALLQSGISRLTVNMLEEEIGSLADAAGIGDIKNMLINAMNGDQNWVLIAIIAVSLFVTIEYSAGTFKNIVSKGFTRESIFFSKLIVSISEALIICYAYVAVYAFTCFIFFDSSALNAGFYSELAVNYAVNTLITIALAAFIVMTAFLIRSKGGTIALSICLYMIVIPMALQMMNLFSILFSEDESDSQALAAITAINENNGYGVAAYYWIGTLSSTLRKCYAENTVYIPILIALAYLAVSVITGLLSFKRRDIK